MPFHSLQTVRAFCLGHGRRRAALLVFLFFFANADVFPARQACGGEEVTEPETLEQIRCFRAAATAQAYDACRYAFLSKNYFARFARDPAAAPDSQEVGLASHWRIAIPLDANPLTPIMAQHLQEFLNRRMEIRLPIVQVPRAELLHAADHVLALLDAGGGNPSVAESFTISIADQRVVVQGLDAAGMRDGVVKLIDLMGMRQAPILPRGEQIYAPRVAVRLGVVPWMGSMRDLVCMGRNAILLNTYFEGEESLFALSVSDAIPELQSRRRPDVRRALMDAVREAKRYGVKTYCQVNTRQKFPGNDPIFAAHPEIRGALTWKADGEYVLCTEHPLVQRYLMETVEELFGSAALDGILLINGGESFYHCFMRSFGTPKGHTNCPRCELLGAETVVANLSNNLLAAARRVNPQAEIIAWPYSAEHVWSADRYQLGLIERLQPGAGILTEIEKDETVVKPEGVVKYIGDYSIDLIGPGERAKRQVAACQAAGVPIHIKSEPELGFEAPRLPFIPCLDRWAARAEALAGCQPDGVWVFPYFRPDHGSSAAEVFKYFWWTPTATPDAVLMALAQRSAGKAAGPHLRGVGARIPRHRLVTRTAGVLHRTVLLGTGTPDVRVAHCPIASCILRTILVHGRGNRRRRPYPPTDIRDVAHGQRTRLRQILSRDGILPQAGRARTGRGPATGAGSPPLDLRGRELPDSLVLPHSAARKPISTSRANCAMRCSNSPTARIPRRRMSIAIRQCSRGGARYCGTSRPMPKQHCPGWKPICGSTATTASTTRSPTPPT